MRIAPPPFSRTQYDDNCGYVAILNDTQEYTKMMTEIYRCAFAFSVVMEIAETHGVRRISMVAMSAVVRFEKRFPQNTA